MRRKAFTLVELMIVISILGIMAAIVMPTFQGHLQQAKEAAAKDNLRILRTIIETYAAKNNGIPPGYPANNPTEAPSYAFVHQQLIAGKDYLSSLPKNPITGISAMKVFPAGGIPEDPSITDVFGWFYEPATKTMRLNADGSDASNTRYYDY